MVQKDELEAEGRRPAGLRSVDGEPRPRAERTLRTMTEDKDDAGRGMLVDEDVSEENREAMAKEMAATIREKRRIDWFPG